jgi:membrane fusion protein (multidrug efflux system)
MKLNATTALYSLLFLFVFSSCQEKSQQEDSAKTESNDKITTVKVVHPKHNSFVAEISIVGTVIPNKKVSLHAMENGVVSSMKVDIGQRVQKGELIAQLSNPELIRKREQAAAKFDVAESAFNRLNNIRTKTPALTTLQQVESAEAEFKIAQAELNAVEDRMNFLKVTAPFSGIVSQRFVDEGALVQNGITDTDAMPLIELQDLSIVRISIPVPESDVAVISVGQTAHVVFRELGTKRFEAKVSRTSMALDPASKTMEVQIDVVNSDRAIRPGMYAHANFEVSSSESVVSLPLNSIIVNKSKYYVSIVEDEIVKRIPIKRGLANKDFFEVLSDIDTEALVIVEGKSMVKAGQKVQTVLSE